MKMPSCGLMINRIFYCVEGLEKSVVSCRPAANMLSQYYHKALSVLGRMSYAHEQYGQFTT